AAATILPRHVLGGPGQTAPSEKLNIAIVGAGGQGMSNAEELTSQNIVALVDVDFGYVDKALFNRMRDRATQSKEEQDKLDKLQSAYQAAKRYTDFRELLAQQKDLD